VLPVAQPLLAVHNKAGGRPPTGIVETRGTGGTPVAQNLRDAKKSSGIVVQRATHRAHGEVPGIFSVHSVANERDRACGQKAP
jgi:hypothetical protein